MPLDWKPTYATGERHLDGQHQRLFEYANGLEHYLEQLRSGQVLDPKEVGIFLSFVETHLYLHFTYRSLLMRRLGREVEDRATRQRLEAYIGAFRARIGVQGPTLPLLEELHHVMHTWLLTHVAHRGSVVSQTASVQGAAPQGSAARYPTFTPMPTLAPVQQAAVTQTASAEQRTSARMLRAG